MIMKKGLTLIGLLIFVLSVLSCGNSDKNAEVEINDLEEEQIGTQSTEVTKNLDISGMSIGSNIITGISVTGSGVITSKPDLAVLSLGIESRAKTVGLARSDAAEAMERLLVSLEKNKVKENHIKTDNFNIYPEYTWEEIRENGNTHSRQKIIGYKVTNVISVQTRDLDIVGDIVDDATLAVGDAIRINDINFTIENSDSLEKQAMAKAVSNAIDRADRMAKLANVKRGPIIFITHQYLGSSPNSILQRSAMYSEYSATPINVGELTIEVKVDAVFEIIN